MHARMFRFAFPLLITALTLTCFAPAPASSAPPNILFIAVDDLNDWIGVLGGHPQVKTPHLDRLARRGMVFRRAYCAAPACNPSRTALMTGRRPSRTGIYHNPQPWRPVLKEAVTLSQHFMNNGYTALGGGKIYHGSFNDPASWDHYENAPPSPKPAPAVLKDPKSRSGGIVWGELDVPDSDMSDYKIVSWAIDELKRKHDKPLFLACGIYRPHMPWQVPRKYYDLYPAGKVVLPEVPKDDLEDVPPAGQRVAKPQGDHATMLETGNWRRAVQAYLASITFADAQVGRLLDALDESGRRTNTVIVLWGDHGWHLGEKEHWRKFALWEEATRTPLIVVAPGVTDEAQVCETPVDLLNVYPTLVDLCGLPARQDLDGVSLRPLLENPKTAWERPALTTHGRNNHALRTARWRFIQYADGSRELYDHDADPMEWRNVAGDPGNAEVMAGLTAFLPTDNVPDAPTRQQRRRARQDAGAP